MSVKGTIGIAVAALLAIVVVALVAIVTYALLTGEDGSESVGATTTPAPDVPRYTQEEVVAKIMNYGFNVESNGETEHVTIQEGVNQTVCGGSMGRYPVTLVDFDM